MMSGIIDFHTHILPGIDDGSQALGESIALLKQEAQQGIRHVVATPHFYPRYDDPDQFFANREAAEALLRRELRKHPGLPELTVGAEVHFFPGMSHSDILSGLTIGGKGCILIEMPGVPWSESMYRELAMIPERQGLTPVIAHMDRYIAPLRTYKIPERLVELPVLVQANASFFLRNGTRKLALKLLRQGKIQVLGSDCHNLTTRLPNLGDAVSVIQDHLGRAALDEIRYYQNQILFDED